MHLIYVQTSNKHFCNDALQFISILWKKENTKTSFIRTVLVSFGMIDVLNTPGLNASLYCTSTHHHGKEQAGLWDVMGTHTRTILMSYCHADGWQQTWTERVTPTDTSGIQIHTQMTQNLMDMNDTSNWAAWIMILKQTFIKRGTRII